MSQHIGLVPVSRPDGIKDVSAAADASLSPVSVSKWQQRKKAGLEARQGPRCSACALLCFFNSCFYPQMRSVEVLSSAAASLGPAIRCLTSLAPGGPKSPACPASNSVRVLPPQVATCLAPRGLFFVSSLYIFFFSVALPQPVKSKRETGVS